MEEVDTYAEHRQNMVAQYIATCKIMDQCLETDRCPGLSGSKNRLEQVSLELVEAGTAAASSEEAAEENDG